MALSYISETDMLKAFGQREIVGLTNKDAAGSVVNSEVLAGAMESAEHVADSYISVAYSLPLPSVPDVLKAYICDIARYKLYTTAHPEHIVTLYKQAIEWLDKLSRGAVKLGFADADEPASSIVVVRARAQVFTDSVMQKMVQP